MKNKLILLLIPLIIICTIFICHKDPKTSTNFLYLNNTRLQEINKTFNIDVLESSSNLYYLAVNEELDINNYLTITGFNTSKLTYTSLNEDVASIDENGLIKANSVGSTSITIKCLSNSITVEVVVSDLIVKRPTEFDFDKAFLSCGVYSEEDNDELDKILETKISNVGYGTRAGVVEAARFLTFDFPYRINYFYEWYRQAVGVDGEGRYYLKGLYLNSSRFKRLAGSTNEPETWGCDLLSVNINQVSPNGLDCSGFVTWALLNGGYDIGDIGAGESEWFDLMDIGEVVTANKKNADKLKVGDLVHSDYEGGHIGMIVGIDSDDIYVAQATSLKEQGLVVTKYQKENINNDWLQFILMDSYYKEDGLLTNMWY